MSSKAKNFKNHKTITMYDVLKPLFFISTIFGLTPFSLKQKFERSIPSLIWCIFFMIFLIMYSIHSLIYLKKENLKVTLVDVTRNFQEYFGVTCIFSCIFFTCLNQNKILSVIKDIENVDEDLKKQLFTKADYKKFKLKLTIISVIFLLYSVIFIMIDAQTFVKDYTFQDIGKTLTFTSPLILAALTNVQFCTFVFIIRERFLILNENLKDTFLLWNHFNGFSRKDYAFVLCNSKAKQSENLLGIIRYIRHKHYYLCTLSEKINSSYGLQYLFVMLYTFFTLISTVFYFIVKIVEWDIKNLTINRLVLLINIITFCLAQVVFVSVICSKTSREVIIQFKLFLDTILRKC